MYTVEVLQTHDRQYWLRIGSDDQVLLLKSYARLVDALKDAKLLQLHVDRIETKGGKREAA